MACRRALEVLARNKKGFPVTVSRIPDRHLRGSVAPAPGHDDDIAAFEKEQDRMTEPHLKQTLPIQPGMLGLKPEFPHELDKARDGQGVAVDYIAAIRAPSPQLRTALNA